MARARTAVLAAAALTTSLPAPLLAQRRAMPTRQQMQQIEARLDSAAAAAGLTGRGTHSRLGPLADDSAEAWSPNVVAGARATVLGVCLEGCTDLNLRVLAAGGSRITEDSRPGAVAMVQFTVPEQAGWRVEAVMAQCSASPCWYGVRIYAMR